MVFEFREFTHYFGAFSCEMALRDNKNEKKIWEMIPNDVSLHRQINEYRNDKKSE